VRRLFESNPQANIVIITNNGDSERGTDLMHLGAMDYRFMPVPDEVLEIYIRKSGHQIALAQQADEQKPKNDNTQDIFVTEDLETRRLLDRVALIAPSKASVLVVGESGTGKERLSRYVHACSNRDKANFIAINCAAIPEGVLEAELFGHEKGAFTGATSARPGKFELAHEGTLLLDEITEMPVHLQAKLLRVLQEGEVDRLGGRKPIKIDVRIIATSNRDLTKAVQEGSFRQDLYYRLNVVCIQLPPLRQRASDIHPLALHFLHCFCAMYARPAPKLSPQAIEQLQHYPWPGNARELENCMHRAFLMAVDAVIQPEHLFLDAVTTAGLVEAQDDTVQAGVSIRDMERTLIEKTLVHVQGNRTEAAQLLGISIRTLRNKLHTYGSGMALAG
ncbi:MAG: sigma-54-dependent Fis family transcriptional regulator, partial [Mariprofundus sp.]|nr:sigma-54-dependent Fis family transcriptional regulator [Mariprofundus sp.]